MARRGPGEGSIRKRKDRRGWEGAIATGGVTKSGNPERISVWGKTRKEVQEKLAALASRLPATAHQEPRSMRVAGLVELWRTGKNGLQERTRYTYERELAYALRVLGTKPVHLLTPRDVHGLVNAMQTEGLSFRAISRALMHLRSVFEVGVDLGLIASNPAKNVKLSRPRVAGNGPARALTKAEAARLLANLGNTTLGLMVFLLMSLGLRRGELLGLEWSAIDLPARRLLIRSVYKPVGKGSRAASGVPKTARSLRTIPFGRDVADTLEDHRRRGPTSDTFVFVTASGTPIHPRNLSRDVGKAMGALGIRGNVHTLRHTHASLVLAAGMPVEVVSRRLGHAQVSTTMNIYRHLSASEQGMPMPSLKELLHE